jgi:hypothetical protein
MVGAGHPRGESITYYLALAQENPNGVKAGSLRIADIPEGGNVKDLAAYHHSLEAINPDMRAALEAYDIGPVREVMSLSRTEQSDARVLLELIREITQEAIRGKTNELWIITFTPKVLRMIDRSFGPYASTRIVSTEEGVAIDIDDPRTNPDLRVHPVVIEPCKVMSQMLQYINEAQDPARKYQQQQVAQTLQFLAAGLNLSDVTDDEVVNYLEERQGL